mmetsp:Transcript_3446/g.5280  ORF Transcript_3446/g.5280 Transcript_3446/m.5280 type:complete len:250 (-) Transcript_3446:461-1210(-)
MINKTVWQVESKIVVKMEVLGCSSAAADGLAKVLILYVGGTIGMTEDEHGSLRPCPGYLTEFLENMPEMKEKDMPNVTVKEYGNLVDSSDMDASDWTDIVTDIENEYYNYDGFVVLQGTDTLAYSGSALSFMLENLGKPVILTGSMIPLSKGYSDARRNLLISVNIAGNSCIPEVCIFFSRSPYPWKPMQENDHQPLGCIPFSKYAKFSDGRRIYSVSRKFASCTTEKAFPCTQEYGPWGYCLETNSWF